MMSILISRFVLNLRGVYTPGGGAAESQHPSRFSDVRFANSVVGTLGAPLDFGEEEERSLASRFEGEGAEVAKISDNPLMEHYPSVSSDSVDIPSVASEGVEVSD